MSYAILEKIVDKMFAESKGKNIYLHIEINQTIQQHESNKTQFRSR